MEIIEEKEILNFIQNNKNEQNFTSYSNWIPFLIDKCI